VEGLIFLILELLGVLNVVVKGEEGEKEGILMVLEEFSED